MNNMLEHIQVPSKILISESNHLCVNSEEYVKELRILDFQLFVVELITKQLVLRVEETNHVLHSFICAFRISYFHQKCNDEVTRLCSFVQLIKIRILRAY